MVRTEFTAEETLLCRAEAKIYKQDYAGALADLQIWDKGRQKLPANYTFTELTDEVIREYYNAEKHTTAANKYDPRPTIFNDLHIDEVCPSESYSLKAEMMPYIYCLLHFRRIETIFDGYRWFDLKRYGMTVTHKIGRDRVETLTMFDPRRALQIPAEVIAAGMAGNDRNPALQGQNPNGYLQYTGSYSVPT